MQAWQITGASEFHSGWVFGRLMLEERLQLLYTYYRPTFPTFFLFQAQTYFTAVEYGTVHGDCEPFERGGDASTM